MFRVDDETRRKAAKLFGRDETAFEEDVQTVKNWLQTQPHLPEIMEDAKIRNFLLLNKCSIEKTKQKIDNYYTLRTVFPDMYGEANPKHPHMQKYMDMTYCVTHPKLVNDMYRLYFFKTTESDRYSPLESCMHFLNVAEVRLYEDCMVGDMYVFDLCNISFNDMMKFTPMMAAKIFSIYERVYSLRIKAMHFLNSPPYISKLTALLKMILKAKIFDRIQVHQGTEILKELLPTEHLPSDYGGRGPSLKELNEMLKKKLAEYQDRFDELDHLKVNENLRPEELRNDEVLGFYGNFKQLAID